MRSAKGHEIDARALSYKSGDAFQAAAQRPQPAAGGVHRQHRPRLQPAGALAAVRARPRRAALRHRRSARWREVRRRADRRAGRPVAAGERCGLRLHGASSCDLYARNKKGKSVLKVPENAQVLPAQPIANAGGARGARQQRRRGAGAAGGADRGDERGQGPEPLRHSRQEIRRPRRVSDGDGGGRRRARL